MRSNSSGSNLRANYKVWSISFFIFLPILLMSNDSIYVNVKSNQSFYLSAWKHYRDEDSEHSLVFLTSLNKGSIIIRGLKYTACEKSYVAVIKEGFINWSKLQHLQCMFYLKGKTNSKPFFKQNSFLYWGTIQVVSNNCLNSKNVLNHRKTSTKAP